MKSVRPQTGRVGPGHRGRHEPCHAQLLVSGLRCYQSFRKIWIMPDRRLRSRGARDSVSLNALPKLHNYRLIDHTEALCAGCRSLWVRHASPCASRLSLLRGSEAREPGAEEELGSNCCVLCHRAVWPLGALRPFGRESCTWNGKRGTRVRALGLSASCARASV